MLPAVVTELQNWAAVQKQDQIKAGDSYVSSGYIVTNPNGGFIEPRTFKDYYNQILEISGLRHFTFHALRHTFASRAMEQGMDAKTLSVILGHYSVSFTLDTYTHVLDEHKHEGMALMDELYTNDFQQERDSVYPVIATMESSGIIFLEVPGVPDITYSGTDIPCGIQYIKDSLDEELITAVIPPAIPSPSQIVLAPNQVFIQMQLQ